jgi:hypothetical protein
LGQQEIGKTRGFVLQVAEGVRGAGAIATFPEQRNAPRQGMPVATLDAGIERLQGTAECGVDGVLIIEL